MGRRHPSLHGIVHIRGGEEGTEWDAILLFGLNFGLSWLDVPFFSIFFSSLMACQCGLGVGLEWEGGFGRSLGWLGEGEGRGVTSSMRDAVSTEYS